MGSILEQIQEKAAKGQKQLAVLVDPDNTRQPEELARLASITNDAGVDLILVGGSLLTLDGFDRCVASLREAVNAPVVIFPGSPLQVSAEADGILFLSVISGRNPEALIGHHVMAAPMIKQSGIEVLATGYCLVESGRQTTASYMSNTTPLPHDKPEIAACTALAGEMLGLQLIYLDGGSGAQRTVSVEMVQRVKNTLKVPLIVGGGIRDAATAKALSEAGADVVVIGNATESNPEFIHEVAAALR